MRFKGTLAAKFQSFKVSQFQGFRVWFQCPEELKTWKPDFIAWERSIRAGRGLADLF